MNSDQNSAGSETWDLVVIGGGAAGFFAAIAAGESAGGRLRILLLEKAARVLGKVKISGGGRCNVTHACFDPIDFVANYPRGGKPLIGPLNRWGSTETIEWFEARGVTLTTESDGRMFPDTHDSQTVIDCLVSAAEEAGVAVRTKSPVQSISRTSAATHFDVKAGAKGEPELIRAHRVLLAPGGSRSPDASRLASTFHPIMDSPVPSLFTFQIDADPRLTGLQGISVSEIEVAVRSLKLDARGPLLITHWGLSGPAILRLSAWGARKLNGVGYHFELHVHWLPGVDVPSVLNAHRVSWAKKSIATRSPFESIPKRLWERLVSAAEIPPGTPWSQLSNHLAHALASHLTDSRFQVVGKSLNKDEFVTCGGVPLDQVNLKTMESKTTPGLYFAGEILDADGITGGFNFQHAWTSGFVAGTAIASSF